MKLTNCENFRPSFKDSIVWDTYKENSSFVTDRKRKLERKNTNRSGLKKSVSPSFLKMKSCVNSKHSAKKVCSHFNIVSKQG